MTGDELGNFLVAQTKGYIDKVTGPLLDRIASLEKALADRPDPEKGEKGSPGADGEQGEKGASGEPGPEGRGIAAVTVSDEGDLMVKMTDGEEVNAGRVRGERGEKGDRGEAGDRGERGEKGLPGADGVGLAGAFIDRDKGLTVTLTNGETKSLGPVVGSDGAPGQDGKDGADALGFEDMQVDFDGRRTVKFVWQGHGRTVEKEMVLPIPTYEGVYATGKEYDEGSATTSGGSVWIAQKRTSEVPGTGQDWRLAVKKGRDGRDGVVKPAPEPKTVKAGK